MFATQNEYTEAVRESQIHGYENETQTKTTIIRAVILLVLITLGYFGFNYYVKSDVAFLKRDVIAQKSVLGVTYTAPQSPSNSVNVEQDDYLAALENMEVDTLDTNKVATDSIAQNPIDVDIREAMSSIIESSKEKSSYYTEDISKEITHDKHSSNRVVVVQKGDTLASLSAKYYGSEMGYKKIIASNSQISSDAGTIYVGQEIVLPY